MKLGLGRDEIKLVSYTPEWQEEFKKVKSAIQSRVGINGTLIEHIGSTAIKDMPAKPIIDILVAVNDFEVLEETLFEKFKEIGFLRLKVHRPGEIVLAKFTDETYQVKTHFIHLVEHERDLWQNLIFFRDYLNANQDARQEYIDLKLSYIEQHSTGIKEYTDHKEDFVKSIFAKRKEGY